MPCQSPSIFFFARLELPRGPPNPLFTRLPACRQGSPVPPKFLNRISSQLLTRDFGELGRCQRAQGAAGSAPGGGGVVAKLLEVAGPLRGVAYLRAARTIMRLRVKECARLRVEGTGGQRRGAEVEQFGLQGGHKGATWSWIL